MDYCTVFICMDVKQIRKIVLAHISNLFLIFWYPLKPYLKKNLNITTKYDLNLMAIQTKHRYFYVALSQFLKTLSLILLVHLIYSEYNNAKKPAKKRPKHCSQQFLPTQLSHYTLRVIFESELWKPTLEKLRKKMKITLRWKLRRGWKCSKGWNDEFYDRTFFLV